VKDPSPDLQSLCEGLKQPADAAERKPAPLPADLPMHLVGEAYKSIHKFLLTFGPLEDQLRGRMERVMAPDGDAELVSVEGKEAWLKKHAAMVTELQQHQASLPSPPVPSAPLTPGGSCTAIQPNWISTRMQERAFIDAVALAKLDEVLVSSSGEGFTTQASFAALHADYLKGLGINAKGTQMQLISLHRDPHLHLLSIYTRSTPPRPLPPPAPAPPRPHRRSLPMKLRS
jgi:hypothetical protein